MTTRELDSDLAGWPNSAASRFVVAGGIRWHVQMIGSGPRLLLLHGTGASTHSWAGLIDLLASRFEIVAPDLPGHGFSRIGANQPMTLPAMATGVAALLGALKVSPDFVVGHSAGVAIALRMALDGMLPAARGIISLNGALQPFAGVAGLLFPPMARLLVATPFTPDLFAWRARQAGAVERLLEGTGSRVPPESVACYKRLLGSTSHIRSALAMMASWDLVPLQRELPRLSLPLDLVACSEDLSVPAEDAWRTAAVTPKAEVHLVRKLGHLAHEEQPDDIVSLIGVIWERLAAGAARSPDGDVGPSRGRVA